MDSLMLCYDEHSPTELTQNNEFKSVQSNLNEQVQQTMMTKKKKKMIMTMMLMTTTMTAEIF